MSCIDSLICGRYEMNVICQSTDIYIYIEDMRLSRLSRLSRVYLAFIASIFWRGTTQYMGAPPIIDVARQYIDVRAQIY